MLCVNPVSTLRTTTCDCGRTALFESTTRPPKLAVVYCAYTGETHRTNTPATIENDVGDRIVHSPSRVVPVLRGVAGQIFKRSSTSIPQSYRRATARGS